MLPIKHTFLLLLCFLALVPGSGCNPLVTSKRVQSSAAAPPDSTRAPTPAAPAQSLSDTAHIADSSSAGLSPAAALIVRACDNYLSVNTGNPKVPEVLSIKAATFYNGNKFAQSRQVYTTILDSFPGSSFALEAMRMVAQSYYEDKQFELAQEWYRKLKDISADGGAKTEASARIAESVFRHGESLLAQELFSDAAAQFERVALEFPEVAIADVALMNAGSAYEKQAEWARAILMYQRLIQRNAAPELLPKGLFRTAKCHEKLFQWEQSAQTFLRVVAQYPRSELAPAALYNAGISFENAEKLIEAAATFEKLAALYPDAEDAPDVLFKAGELYGKIQNWEGVTRVNTEFTKRFGADKNRAVQALCMVGIALYMQNKVPEALGQLRTAVTTYNSIRQPSTVNAFYAAKAQFTIAEITHGSMKELKLVLPKQEYQKILRQKTDLLEQAVNAYSKVVSFGIMEWTTRGIFSLAQAYEDFAAGVMAQQRPQEASVDRQLALELGIARAVDEYLIKQALPYHEQNVKLGIKEKSDDKYILESRRKLLALPFEAARIYLSLADIAQAGQTDATESGFALIAKKLEQLQKVAPYQERAIELLYVCLEKGAAYQEQNDVFAKASSLITGISFGVGETYGEVAYIARKAPVPEAFDPYERFVYKTKLLQQIQGYEDQSLRNFMRTIDIASAYTLSDKYVERARERVAQLLFMRGRSYDLLGESAFTDPPFPAAINDAEKEEYAARFEEIGIQFKEQSESIYRTILEYAQKNYASGEFVTHTYVRLFQSEPREFGFAQESLKPKILGSGPAWKCLTHPPQGWTALDFGDSLWLAVQKGSESPGIGATGFPGPRPAPMWHESAPTGSALAFRRSFDNTETPYQAELYVAAAGKASVYVNGNRLPADTSDQLGSPGKVQRWDLIGILRAGHNVLAIEVHSDSTGSTGLYPMLSLMVKRTEYVPQPPGFDMPLALEEVAKDRYAFPPVPNFSPEIRNASTGNN